MRLRKHVVISLPVFVGIFAILLTIPASLALVKQNQDLRRSAATRTYTIPPNVKYVPGRIIVKYKKDVSIETEKSIDQHDEAFTLDTITNGLPETSMNNLLSVRTQTVERIFKMAQLPQERPIVAKLLNILSLGPQPDPLANYVVLDVPENTNIEQAINILLKDPNILVAEPVILGHILKAPNDPQFQNQWHLPDVQAPQAWDITTGSKNVTVAVIDTGAYSGHPDLKDNLIPGKSFVNNVPSPEDDNGHGTHLAGIIGATTNNAIGTAGINWQVSILPLKACDTDGVCTEEAIAPAIRYAADNGARVINMSFALDAASQVVEDAIIYAQSRDIVMVGATGNDCAQSSDCRFVRYPANYSSVIAVSALDKSGNKASFANYGSKTELVAPGVGIISAWHGNQFCPGQDYCSIDGTSQAAPQVSGLAALLLAIKPSLSSDEVRMIMHTSADELTKPGATQYFGTAKLKINMAKAVQAASGGVVPTPDSSTTPTSSPCVSTAPSASPTPSSAPNQQGGGGRSLSERDTDTGGGSSGGGGKLTSLGNRLSFNLSRITKGLLGLTENCPPSSPTPTNPPETFGTPLEKLANQVANTCGGNSIISKADTGTTSSQSSIQLILSDATRYFKHFAANFGGTSFDPVGTMYIWVKNACTVDLATASTAAPSSSANGPTPTTGGSGSSGGGNRDTSGGGGGGSGGLPTQGQIPVLKPQAPTEPNDNSEVPNSIPLPYLGQNPNIVPNNIPFDPVTPDEFPNPISGDIQRNKATTALILDTAKTLTLQAGWNKVTIDSSGNVSALIQSIPKKTSTGVKNLILQR